MVRQLSRLTYSTADTTEVETTLAAALTQLEALEMDSLIYFSGTEIRVAIETLEMRRRFIGNRRS